MRCDGGDWPRVSLPLAVGPRDCAETGPGARRLVVRAGPGVDLLGGAGPRRGWRERPGEWARVRSVRRRARRSLRRRVVSGHSAHRCAGARRASGDCWWRRRRGSVGVLPPDGSRPPGVRLTLSGRHAGRGVGHAIVSTGLGDPRELVLYYRWSVPGNLTVSPSNPYLDLRAPGPHVVEIAVGSSRPDFRLQRADVVAGPFAPSVAPAGAAGRYQVRVRAVERGVSNGDRGFLGKLILISNDPAEPRKEIPLLAMGPLHPPDGSRP